MKIDVVLYYCPSCAPYPFEVSVDYWEERKVILKGADHVTIGILFNPPGEHADKLSRDSCRWMGAWDTSS